MSDKSEAFAVELQQVWRAGTVSLPLVADVYAEAANALWETGLHDRDAMYNDRDAGKYVPGGTPDQSYFVISSRLAEAKVLGRLYEPWQEARRGLNNALATTAKSLYAAAAALRTISDHFAATDAAAAQELTRFTAEYISDPNFVYPAYPPITPKTGDDPYPPAPKPSTPGWLGGLNAE